MIEVIFDDSVGNLSVLLIKKDISKYLSPLAIVTRVPKLDFSILKLLFWEHAEVCEDNGYQKNSNNAEGAPATIFNLEYNSSVSY